MKDWPWFAWAILGGIGLIGLTVALWRAERILRIKGLRAEADKTGFKVETEDDAPEAAQVEAPPERMSAEEVDAIAAAAGRHECLHDEDFRHFARVLEAVAGLLSTLVSYTLAPEPKESSPVVEGRAVLDMRLKDYRGYLEAQGMAV